MIQQPEIWRIGRLNFLNDMLVKNKTSLALRAVKIGNTAIFISSKDMEDVINLLKRKINKKE